MHITYHLNPPEKARFTLLLWAMKGCRHTCSFAYVDTIDMSESNSKEEVQFEMKFGMEKRRNQFHLVSWVLEPWKEQKLLNGEKVTEATRSVFSEQINHHKEKKGERLVLQTKGQKAHQVKQGKYQGDRRISNSLCICNRLMHSFYTESCWP